MSFRDIKTQSLSADYAVAFRQGRDRFRYLVPIETKYTTVCYVDVTSGTEADNEAKVLQVMRIIEAGSEALKAKAREADEQKAKESNE